MELFSLSIKFIGYFIFAFSIMKLQGKKSLSSEAMLWIGFFYVLLLDIFV